jgi:hypothetical protein
MVPKIEAALKTTETFRSVRRWATVVDSLGSESKVPEYRP